MMEDAANIVNSAVRSSVNFPDPPDDIGLVENMIMEEDATCNLQHLTSKENCGPSTFQRVQRLCQTHSLKLPSNFRSVQKVTKDALAAVASDGGERTLLKDL